VVFLVDALAGIEHGAQTPVGGCRHDHEYRQRDQQFDQGETPCQVVMGDGGWGMGKVKNRMRAI
jgi:hypothetical protein